MSKENNVNENVNEVEEETYETYENKVISFIKKHGKKIAIAVGGAIVVIGGIWFFGKDALCELGTEELVDENAAVE